MGYVGKVGNGGKCEIDSVRVREQVIEQLPEVLVVRVNRFLVLPPDFEVRKNGVSVVPEEELLVERDIGCDRRVCIVGNGRISVTMWRCTRRRV